MSKNHQKVCTALKNIVYFLILLCTKNHIFFSQIFWKDDLSQRNCAEIWPFLYYQERLYFLCRKYHFILWRENERWSFPKNRWKYDIFFKCPEKMVFPKRNRAWIWSFLYYLERCFFFPENIFFSLAAKWKMIFLMKYMEIWCFLYICINVTNMIFPQKNTLKVIDILDGILERVPTILCTFMKTFIDVFIYCFALKKNPRKLNI